MKHSEWDCITVEKLVFCIISIENLILWHENTNRYCITVKNWYFPVISVDFSNISKNEQFSLEEHWSAVYFTEKLVIL